MADPKHLEQLAKGADVWNAWMKVQAPELRPDLRFAALEGACLREYNLAEADLTGARLRGADLSGAFLDFACLADADLREAQLPGARVFFANLSDANFTEADLGGARLTGVKVRNTRFDGAHLGGAHFEVADILHGHFGGARMAGVQFTAGTTLWSDFIGADLSGASFMDVRMEGCSFDEALLEGTDMRRAEFRRCSFGAARLGRGRFLACQFEECGFDEADFTGARVRRCRMPRSRLTGAKLEDADFRGSEAFALDRNAAGGLDLSLGNEPWSWLEREYTPSRLWLHLLLVAAFFVPMGQRAMLLMANPSGTLSTSMPFWQVLFGVDLGALFPLTGALLLGYAALRVLVTQYVGLLRQVQLRTGRTPYYRLYSVQLQSEPAPPEGGWRHGVSGEVITAPVEPLPPAILWWRYHGEAYGWLVAPHRFLRVLFLFAAGALAVAAAYWVGTPVILP